MSDIVKKKRGRKPKNFYTDLETQINLPVVSETNEKKKRGRKSKIGRGINHHHTPI